MTPEEKTAIDQHVFETFAIFYPHEAAANDWPRFVLFIQKQAAKTNIPPPSEDEIRFALAQTLDADERAKRDAEPA
jgi:hypothetical protein